MSHLFLQTLPGYIIAGWLSPKCSTALWARWHWVKMTDLVAAIQKYGKRPHASAGEIGRVFERINRRERFWFYVEGEATEPDSVDFSAAAFHSMGNTEEKTSIPFHNPKLAVPSEWANAVLRLVQAGIVDIRISDGEAYAIHAEHSEMEKVSTMLERKIERPVA